MRYPNLRYGNPTEFAYYAMPYKLKDLARMPRRDPGMVWDWLSGNNVCHGGSPSTCGCATWKKWNRPDRWD